MELNEGQKNAVEVVLERWKKGEKYAVIVGPAGSGKSEIVKYIIQSMQGIDPEEDVCYASYTGKACEVLKNKGNTNVSTLHKLLYKNFLRKDGTYAHVLTDFIPYEVVVIDEGSMVPPKMVSELAKFDIFCIYLGDDAQLSPIRKDEGTNTLLQTPHARLTEIMRQENGSDIIDITEKIRNGKTLEYYKGKDIQVLKSEELSTGMLTWADIVICSMNETRKNLNNTLRELRGFSGEPKKGDKIICLKNNWDIIGSEGSPCINGMIGYIISEPYEDVWHIPSKLGGGRLVSYRIDFQTETGEIFKDLRIDKNMLLNEEPTLDGRQTYRIMMSKMRDMLPLSFTWGNVITCHKAQGSQWSRVLIIEEGFPYDVEEHKKWLYTACTRAEKKAVLIRK